MATFKVSEVRARVRAELTAWANALGWIRVGWALARARKDRAARPFSEQRT